MESLFEKRPVFSIQSSQLELVPLWLISALGSRVHAEEKPAPREWTDFDGDTKCCNGKLRNGSAPGSWCKSFRSSSVTPTRAEEKPRLPQGEDSACFYFIWACYRNGRNCCSRSKTEILQIENVILIRIAFKLNVPGAEGRQVDVKGLKKIRSSSWIYFHFSIANSPCSKNEGVN